MPLQRPAKNLAIALLDTSGCLPPRTSRTPTWTPRVLLLSPAPAAGRHASPAARPGPC
ncbi:MAG: hypothetical protein LBT40_18685 [Deltaproteobacteria bacterium]|nr:hypothetical protein [Deltaproteobacteria bacterium]